MMAVVRGAVLATAMWCAASAHAQEVRDRVGDAYEIQLLTASERRGESSSGTSRSGYTLAERVVVVRDDGLELEYDLTADATADDRARAWQFPARVFRPADGGAMQLLNAPDLQTRLQAWLTRAGIPESACGRWVFTWTSIKIECDPLSVLATLAPFDLRPLDTSDSVEEIDPEVVRRERAESDVAVAQMMGEPPLALEIALQARAAERYSGTRRSRYTIDAAGCVTGRVVVSELELIEADGAVQRETRTTTIERRPIAP